MRSQTHTDHKDYFKKGVFKLRTQKFPLNSVTRFFGHLVKAVSVERLGRGLENE